MIIFPAIDIKDNKCVRLSQGDFDRLKVYSDEPFKMALKWKDEGASFLHIVDLDGARSEKFINKESIEKIVKNVGIPVQVGGGIRSKEKVESLLSMGVERVILGTIAVENKKLLQTFISKYNEKIVVSIDAKNGKVATRGWEVISEVSSIDLCKELEEMGVKTIVYTDISKDGMLEGPNFQVYETLSQNTKLDIIASGGITRIEDILKLKEMNIYGGIIGKAFYDNLLDYKEVEKCLQKE